MIYKDFCLGKSLVFNRFQYKEDFEALSYLNTHAADLASRLTVESLASTQIGGLLKRWSFAGVGIVNDPFLPEIEFLQHI